MNTTRAIRGALLSLCSASLVACGGESIFTSPDASRALLNEGEESIEETVLWASDDVYTGPFEDAPADGPMLLEAAAAQPNIRIGVMQQSSVVYLGATSAWTIRDRANGVLVMSGAANTAAAVTLASVPEAYYYFQVTCSNSVAAISALKTRAESFGHLTFTQLAPSGCTRLLVGRIPGTSTAAQRDAFEALLISQGIAPANGSATPTSVTVGNQVVYRIANGAASVQNVNPVVVTAAPGGYVLIGTKPDSLLRYRGKGEARINSIASLAGVNELPIEEYLYGVVPKELGPELYPEVEAQKAQAIVARTYALAGMGKRSGDGYDLRATTDDQVYGGYSVEHPVSNAAIDATAGMVVTHASRLISTNFFSTSGGHTANNEESFVGTPLPYQRGVPDAERGHALEQVPTLEVFRAHADPTSLRNVKEGDFQATRETWHRWTYEWTAEEISTMISSWAGQPVGRVHSIDVTERGPSGRAISVNYVTDAGTFTRTRGAIRSTLRYINVSGTYSDLPSTLFFVDPIRVHEQLTGFRVYGGGFGHGVGMAQVGAVGMAERGHNHEEILRHYFQGIELSRAY